jgi:alkylation response protein AidB-like acyl-CoA dehydrogenase
MHTARDGSAYLAAIKAIAPTLQAEAPESERRARMTETSVAAINSHRLFRAWIPRRFGGDELPLPEAMSAFETMSRVDGAAGWTVMIGVGGGLFGAFMDPEAAAEVFGPPDAVIAGSGTPSGRAVPGGGGYQASGTWRYASGAHHATTFTANCIVDGREGPAAIRAMAFPASEVRIIEAWDTSGMRGTGSHDFAVDGAFVPEPFTFSVNDDPPWEPGPLYRFPFESIAQASFAPVATGIALRAVDEFRALAARKGVYGSTAPLLDQPGVGALVAEATASLAAARSWLKLTVAEAWEEVASGGTLAHEGRDRVALASIFAARTAARVTAQLAEYAGTSQARSESVFGRCLRDVQVVASHAGLSPVALEGIGRRLRD